jgi:cyclohexyl-isocyanide hydratase
MSDRFVIGFVLFPDFTQLDMTGPFEVFSRMPNAELHLIAKSLEPVASDSGMRILPSATFATAPKLDLICIPGGPGQIAVMDDAETIGFVRESGATARYVTSVCTGSLILGASGLLQGYKAATHWSVMDHLPMFGAEPVHQRVVTDRNRITGGGVTAGIDFGLEVVRQLHGDLAAAQIQLLMEYNPQPPLNAGHPTTAPKEAIDGLLAWMGPLVDAWRASSERAAGRLSA